MKTFAKTIAFTVLVASLAACHQPITKQQRNTAIGAVVGGVAGNAIGNSTGATLGGAALGGLIGSQVQ